MTKKESFKLLGEKDIFFKVQILYLGGYYECLSFVQGTMTGTWLFSKNYLLCEL